MVRVEKQAVEGSNTHGGHGYVCEGDTARVGVRSVSHGLVEIKVLFLIWLSPFLKLVQKGFSGFAEGQAIFSVDTVWVYFNFNRFPDESVHVSGFM
jgi:hypothetical protein